MLRGPSHYSFSNIPHTITRVPPAPVPLQHLPVLAPAILIHLTKPECPAMPFQAPAPRSGKEGVSERASLLQWSPAKRCCINALLPCSLYPM